MVKKALLVGINYKGTSSELKGCINDVTNIQSRLLTRFGYQRQNITMLTDDTPEKPTRDNMEKALYKLVYNSRPGDTLFFHYSGHGSSVSDKEGDESDKKDEVLVPIDYIKSGVIKDDWLYTNICKKIPLGVKFICITDCCHSGSMLDLKFNLKSQCKPKSSVVSKTYIPQEWTDDFTVHLEKSQETIGTVIMLSGCQDQEVSSDISVNGVGQGAFTMCLLNHIDAGHGVKLRNLLKELNARLDLAGHKSQNSQLSIGRISDIDSIFSF